MYKTKQARERREEQGQYKSKGDVRERHGMQLKPLTKQCFCSPSAGHGRKESFPASPTTHPPPPRRSLKKQTVWKKQGKNNLTVLSSAYSTSWEGLCGTAASCHPRCLLPSSSDTALIQSLVFTWANLFCSQLSNSYQSLSLIKLCYY